MSDETSFQPKIKITWLLGTLVAFALFAAIAGYSSRMTDDYPNFYQQQAVARYDNLAKLREESTKTLTTADWVDQKKGTIHIPIDEAMGQEMNVLKSKPLQMGSAIVVAPPPAATNAAPTGATNAPTATPSAAGPAATTQPAAATPPPTQK